MPSKEYGVMKRNITDLKGQFLDFGKRLDGAYTIPELTNCRAFITFSHAEVEIYLESTASKIVKRAEDHWKRHKRVTNAIAAMLAYRIQKDIPLPDDPSSQGRKSKLDSLINSAIASQKAAIRRNHGIKSKNLSELYIPVGMGSDQFNEALLIQLNNLGERRGDHVHQSSQVSLPRVRDPFDDELRDINFLLNEIKSFDSLTSSMR